MKEITFPSRGQAAHGWVHAPQGGIDAPALVLCHGFTGDCDEHGLFVDFGEQASAAGFYVLRFDCIGSGKSAGDFAEYTHLDGWRQDVLAALDFAAAQPEVDARRLGVMGISMGGAAALLAGQSAVVGACAGWAPALYPAEIFPKIMGNDKWKRLNNGETIHHAYAEVEFDVAPCFAADAESLSVEQAVRDGKKPMLLRLGTNDLVIDPAFVHRIEALGCAHVLCQAIEGEDHGCSVHRQQNIDATIAFFNKHLMHKGEPV